MATCLRRFRPASFALRALAWSLGLFGLLRLSWVEVHGLLPLTRLQGQLAAALCGAPSRPIDATLACSGADALALCLGVILAYPARWRARLAGVSVGIVFVLGLNTVRIGTLGRVAASPEWFDVLHVYAWPGVLTLAIAGYVFAWMHIADGRAIPDRPRHEPLTIEATPGTAPSTSCRSRRFMILAAVCVAVFTAMAPRYLQSNAVLVVAALIARTAGALLTVFGVEAHATGNVLWTSRGGFEVTQECISTPLIPIYLAAVVAYAVTWRQRACGLLAAAPLFMGFGIARLLVVALPAAIVASPLFLIHSFYQLLLAAAIVLAAAFWRDGAGWIAARRAGVGILIGTSLAWVLGEHYAGALTTAAEMIVSRISGVAAGLVLNDPQGALGFLPAFQAGLFVAIWIAARLDAGWRRFVAGAVLLGLSDVAALVALHTLAVRFAFTPEVRYVRGWAVLGPLLAAAIVHLGAPSANHPVHRRITGQRE
jgi:exosortase/archaeosortase family protein